MALIVIPSSEYAMTLAKRIKDLRMETGMTQAQLATKARVSQPTISKYENEPGTEYRAHILYKIAGALGTTPEWLLRGTGPKYIKDLTGNIEELKHVAASLDRDQLAILISLAKSMKK